MRYALIALVSICLLNVPPTTAAPSRPDPAQIKSDMHQAYQALKDLQLFIVGRDRFTDPANDIEIVRLIHQLRSTFHQVDDKQKNYSLEPGFVSTLKVLTEMLEDAETRFKEGKKGYALWRLRTVSSYCVSCHTRYEVPAQFQGEHVELAGVGSFERGEFFLATRQFDKARQSFMDAVTSGDDDLHRMDALRNWLLVYTRVQPDPDGALTELTKLLGNVQLRAYDRSEVQGWVESLRRWKGEKRADIPPLVKAENLIRQALEAGDSLGKRSGTVELLRASALLHALVEGKASLSQQKRAHVLYLLGVAYSELPVFFVSELPEMFLEQAIREAPASDTAKLSYSRYEEVITMGYTGSGGTRLPDDVQLKLKELHDLAFGTPQLRGRV